MSFDNLPPPPPSVPSGGVPFPSIQPAGYPKPANAPQPGGGAPWGHAPQPAKRPGMATAALVLGIVGLVLFFLFIPALLALIFGLVSGRQIKRSNGVLPGMGFARAGWIMGAIGLLGGLAFWIVAGVTGAFDEDLESPSDLRVGDCVRLDLDDEEIFLVPKVDCELSHNAEVIAVGELNPDGDREYPGESEVQTEIFETCAADDFTDYIGIDYQDSIYNVYTIFPIEQRWKKDRGEYTCLVISEDGDVTGTIRNSGE